ncbi:hypothetical protein [uncultured Draconibacterium sp.]|uniref:hypothetical protein n=1 Tax=uncultured Draconibacterium sp. TaxID=1573823 RepID=UPI00325FE516
MIKKCKIAFWVSVCINITLIFGGAFIVVANTISSGHNYDNLIIITEDLNNISKAISNNAHTIGEFDTELSRIKAGHSTDKEHNLISLQIVHLIFSSDGEFEKIETYYLEENNE